MARKQRSTATPTDFWLNEAEEIPRGDVGQVDKSTRRVRFYRWWVGSSVVLAPLALLAVISFVPEVLEEPPVQQVQEVKLDAPTKPVAMMAVQNWLNEDPSPLPGGEILSWDGVEIQAKPSIKTDPETGETTEVQGLQLHSMTVVAPSGAVFDTRVQVGYSEMRGAQVLGEPALIPRAPDDETQWPNLAPWPDLEPVVATDGMEQAAEAWVSAFTSGDPDALRLAVGDTAENRSYVPLVQATASDVMVEDVAAKPLGEDAEPDTQPKTVVARVSFGIVWEGQDLGSGDTPSRVSYDVLMKRADTASPVIVAWGGTGTGQHLEPYTNAIEGRIITSDGMEEMVDVSDEATGTEMSGTETGGE